MLNYFYLSLCGQIFISAIAAVRINNYNFIGKGDRSNATFNISYFIIGNNNGRYFLMLSGFQNVF